MASRHVVGKRPTRIRRSTSVLRRSTTSNSREMEPWSPTSRCSLTRWWLSRSTEASKDRPYRWGTCV